MIEGEREGGAMANQDPTKDAAKENGATGEHHITGPMPKHQNQKL